MEKYLDVVEFVILVALESIVHMAHCLARLVPECDKGVLFLWHVSSHMKYRKRESQN